MPTKNPKVSAYIPQHIFDRFQSFCQEKEMSMSQATAVVFAGYFEIEPEVNHLSGLLADRIRDLELKLSELSSSNSNSNSELPKEAVSKLKSELLDILLREIKSNIEELQESLIDKLESELKSKLNDSLPNQLDLGVEVAVDPKKTARLIPENRKIKPKAESKNSKSKEIADGANILTAVQLGERFKMAAKSVSNKKSEINKEGDVKQFINWSKTKDPDGYGWEFKEGSSLFYKVAH
jgi:hypothetical protein